MLSAGEGGVVRGMGGIVRVRVARGGVVGGHEGVVRRLLGVRSLRMAAGGAQGRRRVLDLVASVVLLLRLWLLLRNDSDGVVRGRVPRPVPSLVIAPVGRARCAPRPRSRALLLLLLL